MIIKGARGTGKTITLFEISNRTGATIITQFNHQAKKMNKEAKKLGLNIPTVITLKQYENSRGKDYSNGILLDDFDIILNQIFNGQLKHMTTSESVTYLPNRF